MMRLHKPVNCSGSAMTLTSEGRYLLWRRTVVLAENLSVNPPNATETPLLFERGQMVVTPLGRNAVLTMYWTSPDHEYQNCASIKYEDTDETTVISLSLLKQWQPGKKYAAPPLRRLEGALLRR